MLIATACGGAHLGEMPSDGSGKPGDGNGVIDAPGSGSTDAAPDALVLGAWGTPAMVPGASDPTLNIDDETLSSTATEMYFGIVDAATGVKQLWTMTRATAMGTWSTPTKLGASFNIVTSPATTEESPRLSPDDNTLYFGRAGDIYYSTRTAAGSPWSTPQPLTEVNTANYEKWLAVCSGGYYLVSRNGGAGGQDLYQGQLGVTAATPVAELNSTSSEISSFLSADCLTTYFASNRSGTTMLYTATRPTVGGTWTTPAVVTDFGTAPDNEDPWESADLRTFCFATERFGGANTNKAVYCATR